MNQANNASETALECSQWSSRRKTEVVRRSRRGEALNALSREPVGDGRDADFVAGPVSSRRPSRALSRPTDACDEDVCKISESSCSAWLG
jgi:L-asparaginase II